MAYADDVNFIDDDIRTTERNAEVLLNACKDIGLAVNIGKTKYMEIGRHRGMVTNRYNSYEKVKSFKYLGSLLTNQNNIQEECRLKAQNSCYFSVQTLLLESLCKCGNKPPGFISHGVGASLKKNSFTSMHYLRSASIRYKYNFSIFAYINIFLIFYCNSHLGSWLINRLIIK